MSQSLSLCIVLESFDHKILDQAVKEISSTFEQNGKIESTFPIPTHIEKFTLLTSPHVNKKSREQFEIRRHKRVIYISPRDGDMVSSLRQTNLPTNLPTGVKISIREGHSTNIEKK